MIDRIAAESREYEMLSPLASKARDSRGRVYDEEQCRFRTVYQRDRDRIVHSKAFRRLIHKTQVFLAPESDHYRTRLTHTLEVAQISRTAARILRYNEDLTEAIALGHDLGHTPFGHLGESVLNSIHPGGFAHNEQSLRTVDVIEDTSRRRGLNLTYEVRDGILNHSGSGMPYTLEGQIVRICDRIAYINHDIDDAIRSGVISMEDLPEKDIAVLGATHSERINNLITDLCINSEGKSAISLSDTFGRALLDMRSFMFSNVYQSPKVLEAADREMAYQVIVSLYGYFMDNPDSLQGVYSDIAAEDGISEAVKDMISGMTDRYAINLYNRLFGTGSED